MKSANIISRGLSAGLGDDAFKKKWNGVLKKAASVHSAREVFRAQLILMTNSQDILI